MGMNRQHQDTKQITEQHRAQAWWAPVGGLQSACDGPRAKKKAGEIFDILKKKCKMQEVPRAGIQGKYRSILLRSPAFNEKPRCRRKMSTHELSNPAIEMAADQQSNFKFAHDLRPRGSTMAPMLAARGLNERTEDQTPGPPHILLKCDVIASPAWIKPRGPVFRPSKNASRPWRGDNTEVEQVAESGTTPASRQALNSLNLHSEEVKDDQVFLVPQESQSFQLPLQL
ncbi:hypothetical protein GGX14DRAFT_625969 [Mycena pura]|uniref:Uncharacterized protein n=1 Tax=Mycena pura TaxID=153505 RepID=A0AAD6YHN7_9AGAR|nr:hypothetical protein GGX14DRAFT_625969 [Mycena pura]